MLDQLEWVEFAISKSVFGKKAKLLKLFYFEAKLEFVSL